MTHDDLVTIGIKWLSSTFNPCFQYGHSACGVIISELVTGSSSGEIPDVIGFLPRGSILIECKVSRSDFLADRNKNFRRFPGNGMGTQRWFLAPEGIIKPSDLIDGWGLLEVDSAGKVTMVSPAVCRYERDIEAEQTLLVSFIRRLNMCDDGHTGISRYKSGDENGNARFRIVRYR